MADWKKRLSQNVDGEFFVDSTCINATGTGRRAESDGKTIVCPGVSGKSGGGTVDYWGNGVME